MSLSFPLQFAYDRERVAQLATAMVAALLLLLSQAVVMQHDVPKMDEPVSLTIIAPPVPPEPLTPPPPALQTPQPPQQMPDAPKTIVPVSEAPAPVAQVAPPSQPVEQAEPVKAVAPPQSNGVAESLFAQDVRARIERKKIYPDTARDLGLSGEVEVLYELDRGGNLLRAEIVVSSGHRLLDQAALKAVKSATYKSFPEDAWLGAGSKVFKTKLVFSINQ